MATRVTEILSMNAVQLLEGHTMDSNANTRTLRHSKLRHLRQNLTPQPAFYP